MFAMAAALFAIPTGSFAGADSKSSRHHRVKPGQTHIGEATYYPNMLNGHKMADGSRFHQSRKTAASNKLPLGTSAKVTNLRNGRSTEVIVTDHGPALGERKIDLSKKAANDIGLTRREGKAPVKIKVTRALEDHVGDREK